MTGSSLASGLTTALCAPSFNFLFLYRVSFLLISLGFSGQINIDTI
jgi:hypothetical protein